VRSRRPGRGHDRGTLELTDEHPLLDAWHAFVAAYERGDERACLPALQEWIRRWDECFWQGDLSAFPDIYTPGVRVENHMGIVGVTSFNGVEGFHRLREDMVDVIAARFRFDVQRYDRSPRGFVGSGVLRARGRYTGILLRRQMAIAWALEEGRISSARGYLDHGAAMRAAGLR
jgi:ketosteroid isomerase-like protein